jgi:hypothetical protein
MASHNKFYLYKRDNGIWYIGYISADGRKRWKSTHRELKQEALHVLSEFKETFDQPKQRNLLLTDFIKEYVALHGTPSGRLPLREP